MPKRVSLFKKALEKLSTNDFRDIYPGLLMVRELTQFEQQLKCLLIATEGKQEDYIQLLEMYLLTSGGKMKEQTELDLKDQNLLPDAGFLRFVPQLEKLNLGYWRGLDDLSPLETLENLTCLQLGSDSLKNIKPLAQLSRLEELHLSNCDVLSNISPLEALTNLRTLSMFSCYGLSRIDSLAKLPNLRELKLYGCSAVKKIDGLRSLTNLKKLELIACNSIISIEPIGNLTDLEVLRLSFSEAITDISPVRHLSKLAELDIGSCENISGIDSISAVPSLRKIDFSNINLENLKFIESLENLEELTIYNTCPADLAPLKNLSKLESVSLSSYHWDERTNFDFFAHAPNLKEFEFKSHKEKLPQIRSLPYSSSITRFSFDGSRSEFDFQWIKQLPSLKSLELRSTKLVGSPAALLANKALKEIVINTCDGIGEFAALAEHPALKKVKFIHCMPSDAEKIKTLDSSVEFTF